MSTRKKHAKRFVRLPAYAKVNLDLRVIGKRPDGYHELRTIFQTISLHDTLELSLTREPGISLAIKDSDLPAGPENLVYRAIDKMRAELGLSDGVHAELHKVIPVARGLGGGSSDAAAALIGMLRLTKRKVPLARLIAIAASLGADVPFFLFGGRALSRQSRRRNLSAAGSSPPSHRRRFPRKHRRQHQRRLSVGLRTIDKTPRTP